MKLINVDEAINRIKEIDADMYKVEWADAEAIISFLEEQPVFYVVHCEDCKYYRPTRYYKGTMHYGYCTNKHDEMSGFTKNRFEKDFCSFGEKGFLV